MTLTAALRNVVARAFPGRREGDPLPSGSLAPVTYAEQGYIPMSWPINYWQLGLNALPFDSCSTVESCILAYVRTIAQLPGYHRRERPNGERDYVFTSALSRLLRVPNSYQTSSDFLTHGIRSLLATGNWYSLATRNERFEVEELHWLNPDACRVYYVREQIGGGRTAPRAIFYTISDGANPLIEPDEVLADNRVRAVPARDILHTKLDTTRDPLIGESWLQKLAFDLANRGAMSASLATFFQNQARPSGVLITDQEMGREQTEALRQRWAEQTTGVNAGGTPVLTHGLKWQQTGTTQRDSQVVDALKLSDRTICSVFGVPGVMVGVDDARTFATTEQLMSHWRASGLGYVLDHIEQAMDQFFGLTDVTAWREWVEYDVEALLRPEMGVRIDALVRGVQGGIFSPNEARAKEGYASVEAGDEPRVQQQVVPLSFALEPPVPPAPPTPPPEPAAEPSDDGQDDDGEAEKLLELVARAEGMKAYESRIAA